MVAGVQMDVTVARDTLAEWLRCQPAKPMGSPRVGSNRRGRPARSPKPALYWSEAVILKEAAIKTQHALDALTEAELVCGGEAFGEARGLLQQGPCAKKSAFKALAKIAHFQNGETQDQQKGRVLQNARRALRDVFVLHCISRDDPENIDGFLETVGGGLGRWAAHGLSL